MLRLALLITVLAGCGGGGGNGTGVPDVDCSDPVPTFREVLAFPRTCNSCHSIQLFGEDARQGAPEGMDYDVYDRAIMYAEEAAITVNEGTMPLDGGLSDEDKEDLYLWALCGTPQ